MNANEVLYPQVIDPTPLPSLTGELVMAQQQPSNTQRGDQLTPYKSVAELFPEKFVAPGVISDSINTLTKQILGEYSFGQMGAIAIGSFQIGVSGDIRITPDGLTARNVNGDTTLSIDGATGDVTLMGTLAAGTVIAGALEVGGPSVTLDGANGRIVIHDGTTNRGVFGNV